MGSGASSSRSWAPNALALLPGLRVNCAELISDTFSDSAALSSPSVKKRLSRSAAIARPVMSPTPASTLALSLGLRTLAGEIAQP